MKVEVAEMVVEMEVVKVEEMVVEMEVVKVEEMVVEMEVVKVEVVTELSRLRQHLRCVRNYDPQGNLVYLCVGS